MSAVAEALSPLADVTIDGVNVSGVPAINRRLPVTGLAKLHPRLRQKDVINRPNRGVETDDTMRAFRLTRADGSVTWLINATLHTSVFRGSGYTADFPAYLSEVLEKTSTHRPCLGALFLQGWTGDQVADITKPIQPSIHPLRMLERLTFGEEFSRSDDILDSVHLGRYIADLLLKAPCVPLTGNRDVLGIEAVTPLKSTCGEVVHAKIKMLRAGPMEFLAINGEPFATYRKKLLQDNDEQTSFTMTLGYLDGPIGYLPDCRALTEGGYETNRSLPLFGLKCPFDSSVENTLLMAMRQVRETAHEF